MKIIVTGGAGFIGSHITDALVKKNHRVSVIDNLSTGIRKNVPFKTNFFKLDICDHGKMEKLLSKIKPDIIFHEAAQLDVRKSVADPVHDAKNNILASFNIIKLANDLKVKKFIFASTGGAIYGDTSNRPTPETQAEWPLSPYGIAKLSVDKFLTYYQKIHGLNFVSLRYANVYGPRQNPHGEAGVVSIFLSKMLAGSQPIINGNGKQTRDYVFVDDVVNANLLALKNFSKTGIFNVGTSKETDVNQLFREINGHFKGVFKEIHGPAKQGEQKTSSLSIAKIKKEFGWTPKVDFSSGIKKTYQWFKTNV